MQYFRVVLTALVFVATAAVPASAGGNEGWLPISDREKQIKDVPGNPGAPAIRLYYSYFKDDDASSISVYTRIKILKEGALQAGGPADVRILLPPGTSLKEFAGRTIHPDGTTVDFTGKPLEKTLLKLPGRILQFSMFMEGYVPTGIAPKWMEDVFALPEVTVGSILEYRYKMGLPTRFVDPLTIWSIEDDLYTLQADFRFRPFQGTVIVPSEWSSIAPYSRSAYAYLNQVDTRVPQKKPGNIMELHLDDIPGFEIEPDSAPATAYLPLIFFFYGGRELASVDKYWQETGKLLAEWTERFIGDFGSIRDAAHEVIAGESEPEAKLRKLYARAQQIRNLTFEHERFVEEEKREKIKQNASVQEVLTRGFGSHNDIVRLFVALARAAGFEAYVLQAADRSQLGFSRTVPVDGQIATSLASVKLDAKDVILDPGTPFCRYGLVRWRNTAVPAMRLSKKDGDFISIPPPAPSELRRVINLKMAANGNLSGDLEVEFTGEAALERRLEALQTDEAGRRKALEDEVKSWLPEQAAVQLSESHGWQSADEALTAKFTLTINNFGAVTGRRVLLQPYVLRTAQKATYQPLTRKSPLMLAYPFNEIDEIHIKLPAGFTAEAVPDPHYADQAFGSYRYFVRQQDDELMTTRKLKFTEISFPPEHFFEPKGFFLQGVIQGDDAQAVLRAADAGSN